MSILEGIIQGILQGLAEFLPISSSGHLSIFQYFFNISDGHSITVFLHLGTLFSVLVVFYKPLWGLICEIFLTIRDIFTGRFHFKDMTSRRGMLLCLVVSCLPLLVVYPFRDTIGGFGEDGSVVLEGICLIFTGILILLGSHMAVAEKGKNAENMKPLDALLIGIAQAAATLPGLSRSGATISASLMLGYERSYAFEYSFILGVPAVLAATVSEIFDAVGSGAVAAATSTEIWAVVIGTVVAAVVGFFAIKLVGAAVRSKKFVYFGYYCLAAGLAVLIACALGL